MKNLILLLVPVIMMFSCEKDNDPKTEPLPVWLQVRIDHDEGLINENPKSGLDFAAWIRYEYKDKYYFEYRNLLSSIGPLTYSFDGDLAIFENNIFTDYLNNRCCEVFVWKGPSYIGS
jgi:hypothetical protein